MKIICMLICILIALGFVGCVFRIGRPGADGDKGHNGRNGLPGHDGRSDVDLLKANYLNLVKVYGANYSAFKLREADFDKEIPFNSIEFGDEFKTGKQRSNVYAGLGYSIVDIEIVKKLVTALIGDVDDVSKEAAKNLLLALRSSAQYVREVINEKDTICNDVNLDKLKRGDNVIDVSEINAMLTMMLRQRENVIEGIKESLRNAELSLMPLNIADIRAKLDVIVQTRGKIYKKIYTGDDSLQGLRDATTRKIDELKQALLP
ncbi:Hypothetical protein BHY_1018 (plasmid) [Borrelia nietonii YOR]|uniref:Lipoprotein n=1 Tax=Borrelia nietonii YOR TaxID=1293576 RepID=W5SA47_9SPIR|nr:hypothetical protein [Borrelia nietonii]AHH03969.1 Hypothetical protein BHY_1018 [Borrelia nietonii YOR]UPA09811.1 hypothetical protein bhYOR_001118 [Borrelia nietonii YOR]